MKNGIIFLLLVLLGLAIFTSDRSPRAAIEGTTAFHRTSAPARKPEDSWLFAPCPTAPWATPRHVEEHIV
jgi:hypothetical protein